MELSDKGLQLILDSEVGGGERYYDKFLLHPTVPDPEGTSSGVTIGIGWDCGQNTEDSLVEEWGEYLEPSSVEDLKKVMGLKGMKAQAVLSVVAHIVIPWQHALAQFTVFTVPRYWSRTSSAFPGIDRAPQSVQETLLSLVFNRGTSMEGDRRREMRAIRDLVAASSWEQIPSMLRAMKRLWPDTPGLVTRREDEAQYIESALA